MKFIRQFVVTIIVCYVVQSFLPWWTLALGSFMIGYLFHNKGYLSFLAGFCAVAVLWLSLVLAIDAPEDHVFIGKINQLFPLNVYVLTTLVGGLVGGFAALTGALSRKE